MLDIYEFYFYDLMDLYVLLNKQ